MKIYFLKTNRLGFSHWQENDIEYAYSLWGDNNVSRYLTASQVFEKKEIEARMKLEMENEKLYKVQYWPVFELETDKFIGCCGLRPYNPKEKIYEIGFHFKPEYWGRGYGRESAEAVIKYAFEKIGAEKIFAGHNPENRASAGLLTKLGFRYTGDEYYKPTGLYHPSYIYEK
jgi:ribosomal-protein-alanine N-acetyltransferase